MCPLGTGSDFRPCIWCNAVDERGIWISDGAVKAMLAINRAERRRIRDMKKRGGN